MLLNDKPEEEYGVSQDKPSSSGPEETHLSVEPEENEAPEKAKEKNYEELLAKYKAAEERANQQWDLAVRAKAEVENVRRRAEKDLEKAHKFSIEKFATEMLDVIDSLERASQACSQADSNVESLHEGIELTLKMFSDALGKFGVQAIDPTGELFNPELHEAISMLPQPNVAPNTVIEVIQKGYSIHGRLLRPARVVVSKAAE